MPDQVVIDALFGAGLDRPVEGSPRAMIEAMNKASCVHAIDLPSGINGTTGAVMGTAVRASTTVTFFRRKLGHALLPGRLHCGTIHVAQIGIAGPVLERISPQTWINSPGLWRDSFPVPRPEGHKYTRGHCVVASGGLFTTGAARLAARSAARWGRAGYHCKSADALAVNAAANLAVMVQPVDGAHELAEFLADPRRNVVLIGPGMGVGKSTRDMVLAALAGERAVVLDADALTSFAQEPERGPQSEPQSLIQAIRVRKGITLLTPHEGEFSRVFRGIADISNAPSKLARARAAAAKTNAVCLLKGADTWSPLLTAERVSARMRRRGWQPRLGRRSCRLCHRPSRARHGWFRGGISSRMAARRPR
jgi:NAD(P)H-hydrate repair Nnr-like enzyme with NAD(P)H-hydrate dehydratase domain